MSHCVPLRLTVLALFLSFVTPVSLSSAPARFLDAGLAATVLEAAEPGALPAADSAPALRPAEQLRAAQAAVEQRRAQLISLEMVSASLSARQGAASRELSRLDARRRELELRERRLTEAGTVHDKLRAAAVSAIGAAQYREAEMSARLGAVASAQAAALRSALARRDEAATLSAEQESLELSISAAVARVSALRAQARAANATLATASARLAAVSERAEAENTRASAAAKAAARTRAGALEAATRAASDAAAADASSTRLRETTVALVRAADAAVRRRNDAAERLSGLRRAERALSAAVDAGRATGTAAAAALDDAQHELERALHTRAQRGIEAAEANAALSARNVESAALAREVAALRAAAPAASERAANLTFLRDAFSAEAARVAADAAADEAAADGLRATRTRMRARLLELKAVARAARAELATLAARVAAGAEARADALSNANSLADRVRALASRVSALRTQLDDDEGAARADWLLRRGECQCDDMRLAGSSAAAVSECKRRCAEATVVAGAVLLELSAGGGVATSARADAAVAGAAAGAAALVISHRADARAAADAAASAARRGLAVSLDAAADKAMAAAAAAAQLAAPAALSGGALAVLEHASDELAAAEAALDGLHARESAPLPHAVMRLLLDAEEKLALHADEAESAAAAAVPLADGAALHRFSQRGLVAEAASESAGDSPATDAVVQAALADARALTSQLDKELALANKKAADAETKLGTTVQAQKRAETDVAALTASVAKLEATLSLRSVLRPAAAPEAAAEAEDSEDASPPVASNATRKDTEYEPDAELLALMYKRAVLENGTRAAEDDVAAQSDVLVLMRSALATADAGLERLRGDVERLHKALKASRDTVAGLERDVAAAMRAAFDRRTAAEQAEQDLLAAQELHAREERIAQEALAVATADAEAKTRVRATVAGEAQCLLRLFCARIIRWRAVLPVHIRIPCPPSAPPPLPPQYYMFMRAANDKLAAQVASLRARNGDIASEEDRLNEELNAATARLRALTARKDALDAEAKERAADFARARRYLRNATVALEEDVRRVGELELEGSAASLRRDKLRAQRGQMAEEAAAIKRRIITALREAKELNGTVRVCIVWAWPGHASGHSSNRTWPCAVALAIPRTLRPHPNPHPASLPQLAEAKTRFYAAHQRKLHLEDSIFNIAEDLHAANASLVTILRVELPLAREALRRVREETEAARRAAVHSQADLSVHAAAYRAVLARLGRPPNLAIRDATLDRATAVALVAGDEARRQLREKGLWTPQEDLPELLSERLFGEVRGQHAPAGARAASS